MPRLLERWAGPSRRRAGRSSPWTSCRNLSPPSCATSGAGTTRRSRRGSSTWSGPARSATTRPRRLLEGDALVLSALEIIAHFDPLMWVIENPATGLKTRPFMGAPALGGRDLLQVRNSVQEADAAVDQHALEVEASPVQARQPLRHVAGRQAPPRRAG